MKNLKIFSIILFSSLILTSCGQEWEKYLGEHFSVEYPQNWNVIENLENKQLLPENAVLALAMLDKFSNKIASINILKQSFDQPLSVDEFLARSAASARSLSGFEEIEDRKISIEGYKTQLLTFKANGTSGKHLFLQTYFYRPKEQVGYTVTATLDPDASKELIVEATNIIKSFKLK